MARRNNFGVQIDMTNFIIYAVVAWAIYWMYTNEATPKDLAKHVKSKVETVSKFGATANDCYNIPNYACHKNIVGGKDKYDCPGAKGVRNGGDWCQFDKRIDAENYCNATPECTGFSQLCRPYVNGGQCEKTFQVANQRVMQNNNDWRFWKKQKV